MGTGSVIIFLILCAVLVAFFFARGSVRRTSEAPARDMVDEIKDDIKRERREHHEALSTALAACQAAHPDAVNALSWLAAADGTVSKQELRGIFRFCEDQGTPIAKGAYKAIDSLNAGMSMNVKTTEAEAHRSIAALADKTAAYKLAFYGTANKLCGSQKSRSPTKERFLKKTASIVEQSA